ncbi:MAG: FKBP-type peptidyl-prolyl cis-trans isomerase [Anaerolineae bacterium]
MRHTAFVVAAALVLAACGGEAAVEATQPINVNEPPVPSSTPNPSAQVEVIVEEEGEGFPPVDGDTVQVHYRGFLEDGTEFDSSYERDQPFQFVLGAGQVIPGWEQGIGQLREGTSATLVIPPELAYGSRGIPGVIPPDETLTFEVELLAINPIVEVDVPEDAELVETDSGLQVYITQEGDGPVPEQGDTVQVHYRGTLPDGTEFDNSYDRGQPVSFELGAGQVIAGWDEGIALLPVGSTAILVIPPELGYGINGQPPTIPPNSTLVFEVELVGIGE